MFKKISILTTILCFFLTSLGPMPKAHAQGVLGLPEPGQMINLSPAYQPVIIRGLTVHKDNPFLFDFIVDVGQDKASGEPLKKEGEKLIKYFLASLAIPDKDVWVNLSPYEKNKMVPDALGQTDMGRDLLAQDYILKQITASLIYPEKELGKKFWDKVYTKAQQQFGTTNIPVNTFNKVWIMADRAEVFERNQTVFVVDSHLKVMLEEDYLALQKHTTIDNTHNVASQIVREIVLPELEKEVNTGCNFANLRQIFNSVILSSWYKKNLKDALLNQVYADKAKIKGIDLNDPSVKQEIYEQYLKAYKKGVFNYIKDDINAANGQATPRKYFSGGVVSLGISPAMTNSPAMLKSSLVGANLVYFNTLASVDGAKVVEKEIPAAKATSVTVVNFNAAMAPVTAAYGKEFSPVFSQLSSWDSATDKPKQIFVFSKNGKPIGALFINGDRFLSMKLSASDMGSLTVRGIMASFEPLHKQGRWSFWKNSTGYQPLNGKIVVQEKMPGITFKFINNDENREDITLTVLNVPPSAAMVKATAADNMLNTLKLNRNGTEADTVRLYYQFVTEGVTDDTPLIQSFLSVLPEVKLYSGQEGSAVKTRYVDINRKDLPRVREFLQAARLALSYRSVMVVKEKDTLTVSFIGLKETEGVVSSGTESVSVDLKFWKSTYPARSIAALLNGFGISALDAQSDSIGSELTVAGERISLAQDDPSLEYRLSSVIRKNLVAKAWKYFEVQLIDLEHHPNDPLKRAVLLDEIQAFVKMNNGEEVINFVWYVLNFAVEKQVELGDKDLNFLTLLHGLNERVVSVTKHEDHVWVQAQPIDGADEVWFIWGEEHADATRAIIEETVSNIKFPPSAAMTNDSSTKQPFDFTRVFLVGLRSEFRDELKKRLEALGARVWIPREGDTNAVATDHAIEAARKLSPNINIVACSAERKVVSKFKEAGVNVTQVNYAEPIPKLLDALAIPGMKRDLVFHKLFEDSQQLEAVLAGFHGQVIQVAPAVFHSIPKDEERDLVTDRVVGEFKGAQEGQIVIQYKRASNPNDQTQTHTVNLVMNRDQFVKLLFVLMNKDYRDGAGPLSRAVIMGILGNAPAKAVLPVDTIGLSTTQIFSPLVMRPAPVAQSTATTPSPEQIARDINTILIDNSFWGENDHREMLIADKILLLVESLAGVHTVTADIRMRSGHPYIDAIIDGHLVELDINVDYIQNQRGAVELVVVAKINDAAVFSNIISLLPFSTVVHYPFSKQIPQLHGTKKFFRYPDFDRKRDFIIVSADEAEEYPGESVGGVQPTVAQSSERTAGDVAPRQSGLIKIDDLSDRVLFEATAANGGRVQISSRNGNLYYGEILLEKLKVSDYLGVYGPIFFRITRVQPMQPIFSLDVALLMEPGVFKPIDNKVRGLIRQMIGRHLFYSPVGDDPLSLNVFEPSMDEKGNINFNRNSQSDDSLRLENLIALLISLDYLPASAAMSSDASNLSKDVIQRFGLNKNKKLFLGSVYPEHKIKMAITVGPKINEAEYNRLNLSGVKFIATAKKKLKDSLSGILKVNIKQVVFRDDNGDVIQGDRLPEFEVLHILQMEDGSVVIIPSAAMAQNQDVRMLGSRANEIVLGKQLVLPDWAKDFVKTHQDKVYRTSIERMSVAVELSRLNVENETGGPFGAAIFDRATGQLVSVGVNRVVPQNASIAHAEMMAIFLAQESLKSFTLDDTGQGLELVTSAQPCAMCFGAIPWSGVKSVVIGATGRDVEDIVGFDEGPIHPQWQSELERRGIHVERDVLREDAVRVLRRYVERNGIVYNGKSVAGEVSSSSAVVSSAMAPGGIDLATNQMQWKVAKDGNRVEMDIDPAMIAQIQKDGINSLSAVVFRITPIVSIWPIVGLKEPENQTIA